MTNEKQKLIHSMIEMQRKFIELENERGLSVKDYFAPDSDHLLANYTNEYNEMANELLDLAHAEKESKR